MSEYFLQLRTWLALKRAKDERFSVPYAQASLMGILVSDDMQASRAAADALVALLEGDRKRVTIMALGSENSPVVNSTDSLVEISVLGTIRSARVKEFIDTPFDYLYCVSTGLNPLLSNILARCRARCRVGSYESPGNTAFFELMIVSQPSLVDLVKTFHTYTTQVR